MIKTILIFLILVVFLHGATLEGHIYDAATHEFLAGASIIVKNTNIGAASNLYGVFKIKKNLSAGNYILNVMYAGYHIQNVPVFIKDTSEVVHLEIKLTSESNSHILMSGYPVVSPEHPELIDSLQSLGYLSSPDYQLLHDDTVSLIENYYKYFQSLKPENILSITVDSLTVETMPSVIKVYATFHNESDSMEYVCGCVKCNSLAELVIYNSSGQKIRQNINFYVSDGGRIPDSFNYFTIEPHSSIKYTPVWLSLNVFDRFPSGTYYIKLKYPGRIIENMWENSALNWLYKKPKYVNYMALTGEFTSKDSLVYHYEKYGK